MRPARTVESMYRAFVKSTITAALLFAAANASSNLVRSARSNSPTRLITETFIVASFSDGRLAENYG
jgi:hypothetical protein